MTSRIFSKLPRTLVVLACSLALAVPTAAQARTQDPEPAAPAGEPTDELNAQAQQHVIKAYQQYQNRAYAPAEAELRRAAFFAPNWRPLHFNLAVMAEAQGKLGTAVREYRAFKPFAIGDEQLVAEQRIVELDSRRRKIAGAYKKQIAVGAVTLSIGIASTGAGIGLLAYGLSIPKTTTMTVPGALVDDENTPVDETMTTTRTTGDTTRRATFGTAGILVGLLGVVNLIYSPNPLRGAVKARRQLDRLALGPTRLRLAGNGVSLRF
jgi:hypothetical protein